MGTLEAPENSEISLSPIGELLRAAADGDSTVALKVLAQHATKSKPSTEVVKRSTVESRKAVYRQMIEGDDYDGLIEISDELGTYIDRVTANQLPADGGIISSALAQALMEEFLLSKKMVEIAKVRNERIKSAVFSHINEVLAAEGKEDPENQNGSLNIPELGKRFAREGAGHTQPSLDEGKLRVLLGEKTWKSVCTEKPIPATVEYKFDLKKLLDLALDDVEVLDLAGECMTLGAPKNARLNDRDIGKDD